MDWKEVKKLLSVNLDFSRAQVRAATTALKSLVAINGLLQRQIAELLNLEHINAQSPAPCRVAAMITHVYRNV